MEWDKKGRANRYNELVALEKIPQWLGQIRVWYHNQDRSISSGRYASRDSRTVKVQPGRHAVFFPDLVSV